jgi:hypothetical protein
VNVSLDDIANDGALLEGDNNRSDVEGIEGTNGDDMLTPPIPGASNDLFGLGGADTLNTIDGTPANDSATEVTASIPASPTPATSAAARSRRPV